MHICARATTGMTTFQLHVRHDSGTINETVVLNEDFQAKLLLSLTDISKSVPLLSTRANFESFFIPAGVLMIKRSNGQDALYQNNEFICNVAKTNLTLFHKNGSAKDMKNSLVSHELSKLGLNTRKGSFLIGVAIEGVLTNYSESLKVLIYKKSFTWKSQVKSICKNIVKFNWLRQSEESIIEIIIFLDKEDAVSEITNQNPNYQLPAKFLQGKNENEYVFTIVNNRVKAVEIELFMNFEFSGTIKILAMDSSDGVRNEFHQYIEIARHNNLNEGIFKKILTDIFKITEKFYTCEIDPSSPNLHSFASIVGPSLMGKTQFAFSLAQICPVFYVNFSSSFFMQKIYKALRSVSSAFINCLANDVAMLKNNKLKIRFDSDYRAKRALEIKLQTIGLIWEFVMYSTEFKFDGTFEWFEYYVRVRSINLKMMSIENYLQKLKSFLKDMKAQKKNFTPPIVFIDEFNSLDKTSTKLLRNLCRLIGLPTVLASTNAKIMNLYNTHKDSALDENIIWVNAIRTLPPANVKAILNLLNWNEYVDSSGNLKLKQLIDDLNIRYQYNGQEFGQLLNLVWLMKKQSETCLQGVSLIFFTAFKKELEAQRGQQLNVKAIWKNCLIYLRCKLQNRKPKAFKKMGLFHTLAMISEYQMIIKNTKAVPDIPKSKIIHETINSHFYFFGRTTDDIVIPFGYNGDYLILNSEPYSDCSHYKLFFDNVFFCLAMWLGIGVKTTKELESDVSNHIMSVASIYTRYIHKVRNVSANTYAGKNEFSSQEFVVQWSLCDSTSKGFSDLNPGFRFLKRFIENIQIDRAALSEIKNLINNPNNNAVAFRDGINFNSSKNLKDFLSQIKIPQLLPADIVSGEIANRLKGFCTIGKCNRLPDQEGIDIQFDLFFNDFPGKGFVECKYIDVNVGKSIVIDYVIKAKSKNSPLSMIVTYSMQECLKSADLWKNQSESEISAVADDDVTESVLKRKKRKIVSISEEKQKQKQNEIEKREKEKLERKMKKEKLKIIEGISIYSVYYVGNGMAAVPLVEFENPESVFVIVQTNFMAPKK